MGKKMDFISIEHAGYHAWPAFEQLEMDGWIFRFAEGYTKRANSVNVLYGTGGPIAQKVIRSEEEYHRRNLPCIFRLLSFNDNSQIESVLDARGYELRDKSCVMVQDLQNRKFGSPSFDSLEGNDWLACYCNLSGKELKDHATHIEMIRRIKDDHLMAVLWKDRWVVSCGLGVIHNGFFGIFDIVTHSDHRNRGYGARLVNGMLSWAVNRGAHTAYLQVIAENLPAIRLYQKLGYLPAYGYHYKIAGERLLNPRFR